MHENKSIVIVIINVVVVIVVVAVIRIRDGAIVHSRPIVVIALLLLGIFLSLCLLVVFLFYIIISSSCPPLPLQYLVLICEPTTGNYSEETSLVYASQMVIIADRSPIFNVMRFNVMSCKEWVGLYGIWSECSVLLTMRQILDWILCSGQRPLL